MSNITKVNGQERRIIKTDEEIAANPDLSQAVVQEGAPAKPKKPKKAEQENAGQPTE